MTAERNRWVGLIFISLAVLIIIVDGTFVNVALPSIIDELNMSSTEVQWVQDSYTLAFATLLLVFGTLGHRWGGDSADAALNPRRDVPRRCRGRVTIAVGLLLIEGLPSVGGWPNVEQLWPTGSRPSPSAQYHSSSPSHSPRQTCSCGGQ